MILKEKKDQQVSFMRYKLRPVPSKIPSKKKKKIKLEMGPKEQNPVYQHLNTERNNRHIFKFLLTSALDLGHKTTSSQTHIRGASYSPNFNVFSKHERSKTCDGLQTLQKRGQDIFYRTSKVGFELKQKKKNISILNKYNSVVEHYCKFIPKNFQENEKEMLIAHEELRRLCNEQLFKTEDPAKRAEEMKHYDKPVIPPKYYFKKKNNPKMKTEPNQQTDRKTANNNTFSLFDFLN